MKPTTYGVRSVNAAPHPGGKGGVTKKGKKEDADKALLECLKCQTRYSKEDIVNGLYWIETNVCMHCYVKMQQAPHSVSCFGKPTVILLNRKLLYGYKSESAECSSLCPDRNLCRRIVCGHRI